MKTTKATSAFHISLLSFILAIRICSASPNYYCSAFDYSEYQSVEEIEEEEQKEKIEAYLQNVVPGLSVTFREVIDALIEHGHHVYLTGGAVRDLLSLSTAQPNDVDMDYSGTVEELIAILDAKGWQYTRLPDHSIVIIGDHRLGSIDAMPIRKAKKLDSNALEFSINNVFYHCNNRAFSKSSKEGLKDLQSDRLHIISKDWKGWLYQPKGHRYYKIFRFWKMVGKGYVYSAELSDFFVSETTKILQEDPEELTQELLQYMSSHMGSKEELYRGCVSVMGFAFAHEFLVPITEKARFLEREVQAEKDRHTYNKAS